jgi:biuret amidohydrolase
MMSRDRIALLLIDMQKESKYGIEGVESAVASARPLIEQCRNLNIPVIYTRHVSRQDAVGLPNNEVVDAEGKPIYYRSDTESVEVIDDIRPSSADIVVDKHRWSAFHETCLDLILRSLGIKRLLVGGFVTDGCLMTTVFDAYARDYTVTLIEDISAATNSGAHKAAVLMMANWVYDIEILSASEAVKMLTNSPYLSWRSTRPDELQFTGATLDEQFASLATKSVMRSGTY